ncbi:VanZ family protein [Rathayibacter sp. VKM Ac-2760]|uniref:VanZ family protein n=1 Tax=Rathayibacter sp. VKM Ac-2760 TaxID=2609253 RepID=UPI0013184963|nr:VanZ family protein [Rathayibacter sp. VKM Ac-2760]QHC58021.1 VanZ family protein [Rathayibacter sp. VKM Ac-2760]
MPRSLSRITVVAAAAYLLVLAVVLLWPEPVDGGHLGGVARATVQSAPGGHRFAVYDLIEGTANVLLFVPLGLLASLHLPPRRAWIAVLLGALTSSAVETAQLVLLPHRHADLHDVLANTVGAALGALLGALLRHRLLARRRRRAAGEGDALAHVPPRGASGVVVDQPVRR